MVGSGYLNAQILLPRAASAKGFSKSAGENTPLFTNSRTCWTNQTARPAASRKISFPINTPPPWLRLVHTGMYKIETGHSDINPYALTNEAEFFAVAAEYFFEKPKELQEKHPELYRQPSLIFKQEPAQ